MPGFGTLVNAAAVLGCSLIGLAVGNRLSVRFREILLQVMGLAMMVIGLAGALAGMLRFENGQLSAAGSLLLLFSLLAGAITGEALNIEAAMERFGAFLKQKLSGKGDAAFVEAFVNASLFVCVGALAVVGGIRDVVQRDPSLLFTKAILDGVVVLVMAASWGKGVAFSVIPLLLYQGTISLLAYFIGPLLTAEMVRALSMVGAVLIFGVGVNQLFGKQARIANMLPALLFAPVLALFIR